MKNKKCWDSLSLTQKICYICNSEYKYFLNKLNVVGIGLGKKIKDGFYTEKLCIAVFVVKKVPESSLIIKDTIPKLYKGIETDVVETGFFKLLGLTKRIRPVLGGYSISANSYKKTGTMACLVKDNSDYYILGNNHIIAGENTMPIGESIIQPGKSDGGKISYDIVGYLSKYIPIIFNKDDNYMDCAIARVINSRLVSNKIAFIGPPKGIVKPKLGDYVKKVGRTSELTFGNIAYINIVAKLVFERGILPLKNQILITPMAINGDSGALVTDSNNKAVGLVVAGNETGGTICTPIAPILSALGVTLVT